jgi:DNA polymerase III subunit epsilon
VYRERLDAALRLFVGQDGAAALLARVDEQIAEASAARRYERASWLSRRRRRLEALLERLGGVLRAIHTGARLVLAPHPTEAGRFDAVWIAGGRVVDWGPTDPAGSAHELAVRSARALARAPAGGLGGWLPADAVAETRLVGLWVAAHAPPTLELHRGVGEPEHAAFLARHSKSTAAVGSAA